MSPGRVLQCYNPISFSDLETLLASPLPPNQLPSCEALLSVQTYKTFWLDFNNYALHWSQYLSVTSLA